MPRTEGGCWPAVAVYLAVGIGFPLSIRPAVFAQEQPGREQGSKVNGTLPAATYSVDPKPLPINLPTALRLANVQAIDVAIANERIQVAIAQLQRARALWLPTILWGTDYFRHDGRIQDVVGNNIDTSKSSFLLGAGPYAVFALSDAIFEPLAARQVVRSREAAFQAANNDTMLAVANAYFSVQQARGDLAGAEDAVRRSQELMRRVEGLAAEVVPQVEAIRVRAELSRRRQTVDQARDRWRIAASELQRILRLDPAALIEPVEPPHLAVTLVSLDTPIDDLIPVALLNRPELEAQQALVEATIQRLRQERLRPLVPSLALRGASTPTIGTLAGGDFGAGRNSSLDRFGARSDFDLQVLWQFENLGFGNHARIKERRAENQVAILELFKIQDRVAAEVVQAYELARSAAGRIKDAENELHDAIESATKNLEVLGQFKDVPGTKLRVLIIRPQEVVAAIQALAQAYEDYYGAIADSNRAQFQLYRALGHPAQMVIGEALAAGSPPPEARNQKPEDLPAKKGLPATKIRP